MSRSVAVILSLWIALYLSICGVVTASEPEQDSEWFETQVRPLLAEHCLGCHSHRVGKTSGGLSLDSREDLFTGGDSGDAINLEDVDDSLLVSAIRRESIEMPPEKPLSSEQQGIIVEWIKRGAPWPKYDIDPNSPNAWLHERAAQHWAWKWGKQDEATQSLSNTDIPLHQKIDQMVMERLKPLEVAVSDRAEAMVLLRRVYCDLIGLPPTLDQIDQFNEKLSSGSLENAIEKTVDELLSSSEFGVHWGRHWLDLVRYSETMGHEFDFPIHNAWRYRDAVIRALNSDLPYDRFVQEHLAGDLLSNPRVDSETGINESLVMTGWWWFGDSVQAPVDAKLDYAVRLDNQIDVFSKAFAGMTVACARCHDHKFDAISAADYYGVAGILRSSRRMLQPTDPNERIAKFNNELSQHVLDAENKLHTQAIYKLKEQGIDAWLAEVVQKIQSNPDLAHSIEPPDHPLAWMLPLAKSSSDAAWKEFASSIERVSKHHDDWLNNSTLIADFTNGVPKDWKVFGGFGYEQAPEHRFDWFADGQISHGLVESFRSDLLGKKQHVMLQSPDIDIKHKHLSLLGSGAQTTSTIHVDGYYMQEFHQLLFGDMHKGFPASTHNTWMSHGGDLNKYVGHRAYLSLSDKGNGWFNVQQIRSSDAPAPPSPAESNRYMAAAESRETAIKRANEYLGIQLDALQHGQCVDQGFMRCLNELCKATAVMPIWELSEQAAQLQQEVLQQADAVPDPTYLITIADSTPFDAAIALRGNPHTLGDIAPRGCFTQVIASPQIAPESSGRLELAVGMTTADHPLTSRVLVNRVWAKLLGTGLVASPDNFGVLGGRPTHPELLDAMARDFTANGWSMKRLIREVVLSETYQRSSAVSPEQQTLDPDGLKLTYRNINRMPAESIRDSLLSFSGSLNHEMYGVAVPIYLTDSMTGRGRPEKSGQLDGANRRSIFVELRRNFLNPFLLAFDMPLPATTVGQRARSNVPAQSLSMLNDPFVELTAQRWVEKHATSLKVSSQHQALIKELFLTAFTREPDADELTICIESLNSHPSGDSSHEAWSDLVMSILNSKEFLYIR